MTVENPIRDARIGGITEKSDEVVNFEMMQFLRLMADNPKPFNIRYSGDEVYFEKYYGVFLKRFSKRLKPLLDSYDALLSNFLN